LQQIAYTLAAAGKRFDFPTVGLLRGHPQDTPTVLDLKAFGMQLHWLGYGGYARGMNPVSGSRGTNIIPISYPVPEGRRGIAGALGCGVLVEQARAQLSNVGWDDYDAWWLAAGTGTTVAGLALAEAGRHPVYGAMAVPDDHGVAQNVRAIVQDGFALLDASRGGFAKVDPWLLDFIETTQRACGLPLEPLYSGKALLALKQQVEAGRFPPGTRLIFVHTGGLQGRRGLAA